ncbi:YadA-like family protein [uncultured Cloacibacillus sp.]|uniref:YadA-like family protein n=1 Tax=uncultured Cloacibacillus sp. TaxID=889794 RepID=UPI0025D0AA5B|nr:YadA-like family protein [uncultured Cloacibacillus sp.]
MTGNQLWNAYQRMDDLQESINIVGAHAAALSGLHPIQYDPDMPTTLSAAVGTYRDEYAVAVGVFHYARENVMFNLGASICSDGDLMGRAGVSFAVGKGGEKSKKRAKDAASMQKRMDEMEAMLTKLMEENEQNKQTIIELTSQLEEKN